MMLVTTRFQQTDDVVSTFVHIARNLGTPSMHASGNTHYLCISRKPIWPNPPPLMKPG